MPIYIDLDDNGTLDATDRVTVTVHVAVDDGDGLKGDMDVDGDVDFDDIDPFLSRLNHPKAGTAVKARMESATDRTVLDVYAFWNVNGEWPNYLRTQRSAAHTSIDPFDPAERPTQTPAPEFLAQDYPWSDRPARHRVGHRTRARTSLRIGGTDEP